MSLTALVVSGCSAGPRDSVPPSVPPSPQPAAYRVLAAGPETPIAPSGNTASLITNQDELDALWDGIDPPNINPPGPSNAPKIDFTQEVVVDLVSKIRAGGEALVLRDVRWIDGALRIQVERDTSGATRYASAPFVVIAVNTTGSGQGGVEFCFVNESCPMWSPGGASGGLAMAPYGSLLESAADLRRAFSQAGLDPHIVWADGQVYPRYEPKPGEPSLGSHWTFGLRSDNWTFTASRNGFQAGFRIGSMTHQAAPVLTALDPTRLADSDALQDNAYGPNSSVGILGYWLSAPLGTPTYRVWNQSRPTAEWFSLFNGTTGQRLTEDGRDLRFSDARALTDQAAVAWAADARLVRADAREYGSGWHGGLAWPGAVDSGDGRFPEWTLTYVSPAANASAEFSAFIPGGAVVRSGTWGGAAGRDLAWGSILDSDDAVAKLGCGAGDMTLQRYDERRNSWHSANTHTDVPVACDVDAATGDPVPSH